MKRPAKKLARPVCRSCGVYVVWDPSDCFFDWVHPPGVCSVFGLGKSDSTTRLDDPLVVEGPKASS